MPLGYFTDSTPLTPLRNPFNVLVDAVNANETAIGNAEDVRQIQTFRWTDAGERSSQTGMVAGDMGYQVDTGIQYRYDGSGWVPVAPPFCTLSLSANQTLTTAGTFYAVAWDVELSDNFGMHASGNPTRIVAPVAGVYEITGQMYVSETSGSATSVKARVNGTTDVRGSWTRIAPATGPGAALQIAVSGVLSAGDYIEVMVAPANNGSPLVGGSNSQAPVVTMKYLGPA